MNIRKTVLTAGLGLMLAGSLACAGAVSAFAEDSAAADSAAAASQEGWSDEAKALVGTDTRLGNTIGYGTDGGTSLDNYADYTEKLTYAEKVAANAEANQPKRYVDSFGNIYQPVPSDPKGWNVGYLNADERGCLSCHTSFEDIVMSLGTKHNVYAAGYPAQTTLSDCLGCHRHEEFGRDRLYKSLHGIHNSSTAFTGMGGSCDSCHYLSDGGSQVGGNQYEMWDYAKYDLYKGITDVAAEEANVELSYDQTTISGTDQMFFESLNNEPAEWRTTTDPAVADEWIVTIGGEVENPIEMSVSELKEKFGTTTHTAKQVCIANGTGGPWIFQAEFTGVPMQAIIDYVKPADSVTSLKCTTEDGYNLVSPAFDLVNVEDCLLVTEINGEPLPVTQGYPLTLIVPRGSAATYMKAIQTIDFITKENFVLNSESSPIIDPWTGTYDGKPNAGVLNYPDGKVFQNGEPVHLEGFADAFDAPITKIQYSLDGGQSWLEMETPDNDPTCWTYWRMDFTPENPGAYLLKIRTTCMLPDGSELVCGRDTNFLFTVE
ncbi:MAG: molybdopterin-dependent oxidoreductase [Coriobacteriia bacterium]|nr:molybdopterin-dependent oxidoreductase [Coriobacteriia bacterium]